MINKLISLAALALLTASCANVIDNVESLQLRAGEDDEIFYASIEGGNEDGATATKVYADSELRVLWNADDRISIFRKTTGNEQFKFTGADGANAGIFSYVSGNKSQKALDCIYSLYPYSDATSVSTDGVVSLTMPAEQVYKENSFGIGANTMLSVTSNNQLKFRNVGAYLSFKFYGDNISIKRITLKGNNGEKLAGRATITMPLDGTPAVEMLDDATETITLTCEKPVKIGTTSGDPTEFWIVLPPTEFTKGITVTVTDDLGGIFEMNSTTHLIFTRNKLTRLSAKKIEPNYDNALTLQREALIALYNALDGDNWDNNENWCSDKPISEWYGVYTEGQWVRYLSLKDNNLNGVLPEEIWRLSSLYGISFSENPCLHGELSENISNLSKLSTLEIDRCRLSGNLPKNLSLCENLTFIDLLGNCFSGNIPVEYSTLFDKVGYCLMGDNNLSGEVPQEIVNTEYFIHAWADITVENALTIPTNMRVPEWEAYDIYGNHISSSIYGENKLTLMVNCAWLNNVQQLYPIYTEFHRKGLEIISFDRSNYVGSASQLKEQAEEAALPWPCFYAMDAFKGKYHNWSSYSTCGYMGGGWTLVNSFGEVVESSYIGGNGAILNTIRQLLSDNEGQYFSKDFSQHLKCENLQTATIGNGIPIILMGDGYSDLSIANGKYMSDMNVVYNALFSEEPFASYKDFFTVSVVKLVSLVDGFDTDYNSALDCWYLSPSSTIVGPKDFSTVLQAAKYGMGNYDIDLATIGIILNSDRMGAFGDRCFPSGSSSTIGNGLSVAYISAPDEETIKRLVQYYMIGYGFAKLAEEYSGESNNVFSLEGYDYQGELSKGWLKNIDFTGNPDFVKWNQFIYDERYSDEKIGCYEGAFNYSKGVWRPSENSIMRNKTGGFNAPSRMAIWYRINKLAYGEDWEGNYEDFVAFDLAHHSN